MIPLDKRWLAGEHRLPDWDFLPGHPRQSPVSKAFNTLANTEDLDVIVLGKHEGEAELLAYSFSGTASDFAKTLRELADELERINAEESK